MTTPTRLTTRALTRPASFLTTRQPGYASYLRATLTFLREAGQEQLRAVPVFGPMLLGASAALTELSRDDDGASFEEHLLRLTQSSADGVDTVTALSAVILDRQADILRTLRAQGLAEHPEFLTDFAITAALFAYRQRVAHETCYADYRGIEGVSRTEHAASLPLDQVFVEPTFLPEHFRDDDHDHHRLLSQLIDDGDLTPDQKATLEREYASLSAEHWQAQGPIDQVLQWPVLLKARHVVLLGGPGTGKSTFLRHLARLSTLDTPPDHSLDGLTPVILPLASFADHLNISPACTLADFISTTMRTRGGSALELAIRDEISAGNVLFLLDGVDEIPDMPTRAGVVKALDRFITDTTSNAIVITSRPYGYIRVSGSVQHFTLPNFSSLQIETFVRQWQLAFERWRHPIAPDVQAARDEADEMLAEIRRSQKVAEIAANPLMLVIISLIRYEGRKLPEQRVELYHRAVNTLLDTWNQWRSSSSQNARSGQLPVNALVRVLGVVAEWTRRTKPTGIIHRAELTRELSRVLRALELDDNSPDVTAESYIRAAAGRSGLLEERGQNIFAFWHPTFEEYLAAVDLATPVTRAICRLLPLRTNPRWREVLLLAVGYVGIVQRDPETATALVKAFASEELPVTEPLLHSALRLAAACIVDDVGIRRSVVEDVLLRLGVTALNQPYAPLVEAFVDTARAVPRFRLSDGGVHSLQPVSSHPNWKVRMECARLLANVSSDCAVALSSCELMLNDPDPDVSCHAALGLAKAGDYRPEVWRALAHFYKPFVKIEPNLSDFVASAPANAHAALLALFDTGDSEDRFAAGALLWRLGFLNDALVEQLVGNFRWRSEALLFRQRLGRLDGGVIGLLSSRLKTAGFDERLWIASLLVELRQADSALLAAALVPVLAASDPAQVLTASEILLGISVEDTEVSRAISRLLKSSPGKVPGRAVALLLRTRAIDDQVICAFIDALPSEDVDMDSAMNVVDRASPPYDDVARTILRLAERLLAVNHPRGAVDLRTFFGRAISAPWGLSAIDALLDSLRSGSASRNLHILEALVRLGSADLRVEDALIEIVSAREGRPSDQSALEVSQAAALLIVLGRPELSVSPLIELLQAPDYNMASRAADLLSRIPESLKVERLLQVLSSCRSSQQILIARAILGVLDTSAFWIDGYVRHNMLADIIEFDDRRFYAGGPTHPLLVRDRSRPLSPETSEKLTPVLFGLLNDSSHAVVIRAAALLSQLGRRDASLIDALRSVAEMLLPTVALEAALVLAEIGEKTIAARILKSLATGNGPDRESAAEIRDALLGPRRRFGGFRLEEDRPLRDVSVVLADALSANPDVSRPAREQLEKQFQTVASWPIVVAVTEHLVEAPSLVLKSLRKMLRGNRPLSVEDSRLVASLTTVDPSDTEGDGWLRRWIFAWASQRVDPFADSRSSIRPPSRRR